MQVTNSLAHDCYTVIQNDDDLQWSRSSWKQQLVIGLAQSASPKVTSTQNATAHLRTILGQYWSVFRAHCLHSRHVRTKQPTPARSPTFQPVAPEPTSVTMPTISCLLATTYQASPRAHDVLNFMHADHEPHSTQAACIPVTVLCQCSQDTTRSGRSVTHRLGHRKEADMMMTHSGTAPYFRIGSTNGAGDEPGHHGVH